jgi:DNA-binding CsgD family transcriptional regulator
MSAAQTDLRPAPRRANLHAVARGEHGAMDDAEADKAAIMAVMKAETDAWLRRDFEAQAQHWVHSPQTRLMTTFASLGTRVDEGWDAIGPRLKRQMERFSQTFDFAERVRWDRVNIVVVGDMAWVSYVQISSDTGDDFEMAGVQHELKIFQRIDGTWKIGCLALMQRTVDHVTSPLIEVDADAKVLWMNRQAEVRIRDHPGLVVVAGRLRARRRDSDSALRDAVSWAHNELKSHVPPNRAAGQARAVPLGEDDAAAPLYCWVVLEDAMALVSFDDANMVARRIDLAAEVYGLSPAQVRLARLVVDGNDLAAASNVLGVSVNTLRTHLQRMFDKTGARSQAALIRALLSAEAPTK